MARNLKHQPQKHNEGLEFMTKSSKRRDAFISCSHRLKKPIISMRCMM